MALFYIQQYGNQFEVRFRSTMPAANAWQGSVILPQGLAAENITYGSSIGEIWQTPPTFTAGHIDFAGGAPTGFAGDGLLFRFTAVPQSGFDIYNPTQTIRFDAAATAAYAADGKGTELASMLQPITVNVHLLVSTSSAAAPAPLAQTPPDPFTITLVHEQGIFQGRPAIVFAAIDPDAGIDHYEIQEHTENGIIAWHPGTSPYLVDAATQEIEVKAVDRTGAARVESIAIHTPAAFGGSAFIISVILIAVIIVMAYFARKWLQSRPHSSL